MSLAEFHQFARSSWSNIPTDMMTPLRSIRKRAPLFISFSSFLFSFYPHYLYIFFIKMHSSVFSFPFIENGRAERMMMLPNFYIQGKTKTYSVWWQGRESETFWSRKQKIFVFGCLSSMETHKNKIVIWTLKEIHRNGSYHFLEVEGNPWSSKAKFPSRLTLLDKQE